MPAQTPIAVGSCLRGNAATRIESESGFSSARADALDDAGDDQLGVGRARARTARPMQR